jgi:hypothetical protein
MFLVSYIVFQLPGTLLIKKIHAPLQFGGAMMLVSCAPTVPVVGLKRGLTRFSGGL